MEKQQLMQMFNIQTKVTCGFNPEYSVHQSNECTMP